MVEAALLFFLLLSLRGKSLTPSRALTTRPRRSMETGRLELELRTCCAGWQPALPG